MSTLCSRNWRPRVKQAKRIQPAAWASQSGSILWSAIEAKLHMLQDPLYVPSHQTSCKEANVQHSIYSGRMSATSSVNERLRL